MDYQKLGRRLKRLRERSGYTGQELASMLGMSRTGYLHWEAGDRKIPAAELGKLARFYGLTIDELIDETKEPDLDQLTGPLFYQLQQLSPEARRSVEEYIRFVVSRERSQRGKHRDTLQGSA